MQAISKKHQANVNKAVYWLAQYKEWNTLRDKFYGEESMANWRMADKKCEKAFDRYLDYLAELPKREAQRIEKAVG
jgi:hypothetical protein